MQPMTDFGLYAPLVAFLVAAAGAAAAFAKWLDSRTEKIAAEFRQDIDQLEERVRALENGQHQARELLVEALEHALEAETRRLIKEALKELH